MSDKKTDMELKDYTEKSFGIYGNTKPYKDDLKKMGGKFNPRLQNGPGWIFANHLRSNIEKYIETGEVTEFQWKERDDNRNGDYDNKGRDNRRNNFRPTTDQQISEMRNNMYLLLERVEFLEAKVFGQDGYPPLNNNKDSENTTQDQSNDDVVFEDEDENKSTSQKAWVKPHKRLLKKN